MVFATLNPSVKTYLYEYHMVYIVVAICVPVYFMLHVFKEDEKQLDEFIKRIREKESKGDSNE